MDINKFGILCIQGNVMGALEYINEFGDVDKEIVEIKNKYKERFITRTEEINIDTDDVWIKQALNQYYDYYRKVLTGNSIESAEQSLLQQLLPYINIGKPDNIDEVEVALCKMFYEKGYSFLGGRTSPYLGPYIWKTTCKKEFDVQLVDSEQTVTVYFISDFLMQSWMHFVTFGRNYAGGWAKEEGLYCVNVGEEMSDITSEVFQVRYLKHEAQHLSDYKMFPCLKGWELEYRAKCVELIYYSKTHELLDKFLNEAKNNVAFPHAYAAYRIVENLSKQIFDGSYVDDKGIWKAIDPIDIRESVLQLFEEDTRQRGGNIE